MEVFDVVKTISMLAGYIITITTCLLLFIKPIRIKIADSFKKNQDDEELRKIVFEMNNNLSKHMEIGELQNEALLAILRDHITEAYYKYKDVKRISTYKRESLIKEYTIYHKMNGNSYVDVIYEEMLNDWEVV